MHWGSCGRMSGTAWAEIAGVSRTWGCLDPRLYKKRVIPTSKFASSFTMFPLSLDTPGASFYTLPLLYCTILLPHVQKVAKQKHSIDDKTKLFITGWYS